MRKVGSILVVGAVVAACSDSTSPVNGSPLATLIQPDASVGVEVIPNEYIVVLKKGVGDVRGEATKARGLGAVVMYEWESALKGFAVRLNPTQLATLRQNRNIEYISPNGVAHIDVTQQCTPYGVGKCGWGLDRISESGLPMDGVYNMPVQAPNQGASVHFYSIDTGANFTHNDFGGRASTAPDFVNNDANSVDDNGHGTHTSTTMVGTTYGVAKQGLLVATKVCDAFGSCPFAAIISGVNWVTANSIHPAVANVSLGGPGTNPPLETAVANSIASGVTYAIAAGNSSANACNFNPARVPTAITVAATGSFDGLVPPNQPDARASYSNFGTCVDLFAPGSQIIAGWIGSNSATNVISGTSMATPHVAGAAGLVLDVKPNFTPAQVTTLLLNNTTNNVVTNPGAGSPNKLLNVKIPPIP